MTLQDFLIFNDFSLIEKAIQSLFCGNKDLSFLKPADDEDPNRANRTAGKDNVAFYTAFQNATFRKCRPRVFTGLSGVNRVVGSYVIDANGNLREKAWRGVFRFGIITQADYTYHTALRSLVLSVIPTILPAIAADNSQFKTAGVNAVLEVHEVSEFWARDLSTTITIAEDNYQSVIPCEIAFSVNAAKWPAGMITT